MTKERQLARARKVFDIEIKGLKATRDSLGASFTDAVKLILDVTSAGGLVVVTGVGKNLHVAEKMSAIFSSTGTRSVVLNPVQAMHGDLGMVSSRDLLLALSFSGESDEVLRLLPPIRRHGLKIISMTGNAKSTLAKLSDIHIAIPCGREACPFGMAPTNSVTATLATGDALAMVLIDARKFSLADYAANHPAGAIGRALVLRVSDIMRADGHFAKVAPTATVMETVMAMTAAKGGSAVVVDGKDKLLGIFTDGDFRRFFDFSINRLIDCDGRLSDLDAAKRGDKVGSGNIRIHQSKKSIEQSKNRIIEKFITSSIGEVMTRSPLFVYDDNYAADLLKIFEKRRIDDLPVCDRKGRVVGLVDIQDLPKMKVL